MNTYYKNSLMGVLVEKQDKGYSIIDIVGGVKKVVDRITAYYLIASARPLTRAEYEEYRKEIRNA